MRRASSIVLVLMLLALSTASIVPIYGVTGSAGSPQEKAYDSHDPIRIDSNSDFSEKANSEGWKGNGSADNPYIIENYDIDGSDAGYCIYIGNTTVHFIIRNCTVHHASGNSWTYHWNSGIVLYDVENGVVDNNTVEYNTGSGIYVFISDYNRISNNTISSNSDYGIYLDSSYNVVENNSIADNDWGVYLSSSNNSLSNNAFVNDSIEMSGFTASYWASHEIDTTNTVNGKPIYYIKNEENMTLSESSGEVILVSCKNVTVEGQELNKGSIGAIVAFSSGCRLMNITASFNGHYGIHLYSSDNTTVYGCNASSNGENGILMDGSNWNDIVGCSFTSNADESIYLDSSSNNTISDNTVKNSGEGVYLWHNSENNTISNNTVIGNDGAGIEAFDSNSNTIYGNYLEGNDKGVLVFSSSYSRVYGNRAENNSRGIEVKDSDHCEVHHNIASGNTNDGIYLYYSNYGSIWNNTVASNDDSGIVVYESDNNQIMNNTLEENSDEGIYLYSSNHNFIHGNSMADNKYGVDIYSSDYSVISNNTIHHSGYAGIYMTSSSFRNSVADNGIMWNYYGIYLSSSSYENTFFNNTVYKSGKYGFYISSGDENQIYHNNFIDNEKQAWDGGDDNLWNVSYPTGGNYWSDYSGNDIYSGPGQNKSGSDGIGDTPYSDIGGTGGNPDSYPLMQPMGYMAVRVTEGWNLISIPWLDTPVNISDAINGVSWDRAMVYMNGIWYTYNVNRGNKFNLGFPMVDNTMGIWLHCNSSGAILGKALDGGTTNISLHKGWNLIGYPSGNFTRAVGDAFSEISYEFLRTANDTGALISLSEQDTMVPGTGYWIYVGSDCVWRVEW